MVYLREYEIAYHTSFLLVVYGIIVFLSSESTTVWIVELNSNPSISKKAPKGTSQLIDMVSAEGFEPSRPFGH